MSESTEAPASVNTRIKSPGGFEYQFTMRDDTVSKLMDKLKVMEEIWTKGGFTPVIGKSGWAKKEPKYIEGEQCPLDGGRLIEPEAGTNRPIKCENNKWNSVTKQAYGCAYTRWPNDKKDDVPVRQVSEEDYGV